MGNTKKMHKLGKDIGLILTPILSEYFKTDKKPVKVKIYTRRQMVFIVIDMKRRKTRRRRKRKNKTTRQRGGAFSILAAKGASWVGRKLKAGVIKIKALIELSWENLLDFLFTK